jgi:phosphoribosyl-ATP pyrophosphohydrolase/phosphoribosyl-AMP cyclohydrolase
MAAPAEPTTLLEGVTFDGSGLVPVVAQEAATGQVRMVAWANREALERTLATREAHFWSRSRAKLWRKGEESGHTLAVREVRIDCDGDVVLYTVDPTGPSCHTGATSCFYRASVLDPAAPSGRIKVDDGPPDPPAVILARVADVIARRRKERPERSYVVSLLDRGFKKINEKISEEAGELVEALPQGDAAHTAHEAADLIFHVLVGLEAAGVPAERVFGELGRRFGVSGIDEKASRKK